MSTIPLWFGEGDVSSSLKVRSTAFPIAPSLIWPLPPNKGVAFVSAKEVTMSQRAPPACLCFHTNTASDHHHCKKCKGSRHHAVFCVKISGEQARKDVWEVCAGEMSS